MKFQNKVLMVLCSGIAITVFLLWGFKDHRATGRVIEIRWQSEIQQYQWTRTTDGNWKLNILDQKHVDPTNGYESGEVSGVETISCYRKTDFKDRYSCNSKMVCNDKGANCRIVYETCYRKHEYCDFYTWKWILGEKYTTSGYGYIVIDPVVRNAPNQYTTEAQYTYKVVIEYNSKKDLWTFHPKTISSYKQWKIGQEVALLVNNFGVVQLEGI